MASKQKSSTAQRKAKTSAPPSAAKNAYLIAYNAVSAALWAGVLYQTLNVGTKEITAAHKSQSLFSGKPNPVETVLSGLSTGRVFDELDNYTRLTQSVAGLEILHSLLGVVRAPLLTTLMQVASRFLLVWGIAYQFPESTRHNPAYATMLLAWSITEVVRYSYFVFSLSGVGVPKLWTWLRYNTFLVLYPLGVASECWCVYSAIPLASQLKPEFGYALWAILAIYIPGFYVLFTHMLKQRSKIMREARRN